MFWEIVCKVLQQILGNEIPMSCLALLLCNFLEESVMGSYIYLVTASKKSYNQELVKLTKDQWLITVEEIFLVKTLSHILRLREAQLEEK